MPDADELSYDVVLIEERLPNVVPYWTAVHPQLPGCNATGRTQDEALENLDISRNAWLKVAGDLGEQMPPPSEHPVQTVIYAPVPGASLATSPGASETQNQQVAA